jgi:hypothetical protein
LDTEVSIGDAIQLFLRKSKLKGNMQSMQIAFVWEKLMGATIAKYTSKIEIIKDTLMIHTEVAPLKQELNFQKDKIVERVNEALGENTIKQVLIK